MRVRRRSHRNAFLGRALGGATLAFAALGMTTFASCRPADEGARTASNEPVKTIASLPSDLSEDSHWVDILPAMSNPLGAPGTNVEPGGSLVTPTPSAASPSTGLSPSAPADCDALEDVVARSVCRTKETATDAKAPAPPAPPAQGTLLKQENLQSSALSPAQVCFLPAGRHVLTREPELRINSAANVTSHFVSLATAPSGCAFSEGYVAVAHVADISESWVRPVATAPITSDFNKLRSCGSCSNPHQGIDYGAPEGTPVRAARGGQVFAANWNGDFGRIVVLFHTLKRGGRALTLTSRYAHNSALRVQSGIRVAAGTLLAHSGNSGSASQGAHLHFDMLDVHDDYPPSGSCRVNPHALSAVFGPLQPDISRSDVRVCPL